MEAIAEQKYNLYNRYRKKDIIPKQIRKENIKYPFVSNEKPITILNKLDNIA